MAANYEQITQADGLRFLALHYVEAVCCFGVAVEKR